MYHVQHADMTKHNKPCWHGVKSWYAPAISCKSMALGWPVNSILTTGLPRSAGQLLFDLGHCIDDKRVQAKGPQQNICCTKSYHGLRDFARVDEALQRLVYALWPRLLEVSPVQPVPLLHVALTSAALLPHSSSQRHETENRWKLAQHHGA